MTISNLLAQNPDISANLPNWTSSKYIAMRRPLAGESPVHLYRQLSATKSFCITLSEQSKKEISFGKYLLLKDENSNNAYKYAPRILSNEQISDLQQAYTVTIVENVKHYLNRGSLCILHTDFFSTLLNLFENKLTLVDLLSSLNANTYGELLSSLAVGRSDAAKNVFETVRHGDKSSAIFHRCADIILQAKQFETEGSDSLQYLNYLNAFKKQTCPVLKTAFDNKKCTFTLKFNRYSEVISIHLGISKIGDYLIKFDPYSPEKVHLSVVDDSYYARVSLENIEAVAQALVEANIKTEVYR